MAYRLFADDNGVSWQVWDVRPARVERRIRERRMTPALRRDAERRSGEDRRHRVEQRSLLKEELMHGWLAFQAEGERRRYAPIPEDWTVLSAEGLMDLLRRAQPVSSSIADGGLVAAEGPDGQHTDRRHTGERPSSDTGDGLRRQG